MSKKQKVKAASSPKKKAKPKAKSVPDAVAAFRLLIEEFRYPMGSMAPTALTNFTFFTGAGFSKSWDENAPVGSQLFTLDVSALDDIVDSLVLSRSFGVDGSTLSPDDLRQIIYQLDMYERYPDVRSRYIDSQNGMLIRAGLRAAVLQRYSELSSLNYFDPASGKFPLDDVTADQEAILGFFKHLQSCSDGSTSFAEGVRYHFVTTNYDFVIETILDNVLELDDTLSLYTYRGFTPATIAGQDNPKPTHQHWLGSHLIKLNGGFEILRSGDRYSLDYGERSFGEILAHPPVLMMPSREQDYSDPYFRTIFPKAVRLMRDSRVLVLVGYSLPEDDALMRFIIRQFAEEPEDGREKMIFYIDPGLSKAEKLERLQAVFPSMEAYQAPQVLTYEGTFSSFAKDYLKLVDPSDSDDF